MKLVKNENNKNTEIVTDEEAREAFVKILKWLGEDPSREGLLETPKRVTKAFKEYFKGYKEDPKEILSKTFGDVEGYSDMVVQKNISVQSHCEHHMAPIIGIAHVAYIPNERVVGLSKIARVVYNSCNFAESNNSLIWNISNMCDTNNRCHMMFAVTLYRNIFLNYHIAVAFNIPKSFA